MSQEKNTIINLKKLMPVDMVLGTRLSNQGIQDFLESYDKNSKPFEIRSESGLIGKAMNGGDLCIVKNNTSLAFSSRNHSSKEYTEFKLIKNITSAKIIAICIPQDLLLVAAENGIIYIFTRSSLDDLVNISYEEKEQLEFSYNSTDILLLKSSLNCSIIVLGYRYSKTIEMFVRDLSGSLKKSDSITLGSGLISLNISHNGDTIVYSLTGNVTLIKAKLNLNFEEIQVINSLDKLIGSELSNDGTCLIIMEEYSTKIYKKDLETSRFNYFADFGSPVIGASLNNDGSIVAGIDKSNRVVISTLSGGRYAAIFRSMSQDIKRKLTSIELHPDAVFGFTDQHLILDWMIVLERGEYEVSEEKQKPADDFCTSLVSISEFSQIMFVCNKFGVFFLNKKSKRMIQKIEFDVKKGEMIECSISAEGTRLLIAYRNSIDVYIREKSNPQFSSLLTIDYNHEYIISNALLVNSGSHIIVVSNTTQQISFHKLDPIDKTAKLIKEVKVDFKITYMRSADIINGVVLGCNDGYMRTAALDKSNTDIVYTNLLQDNSSEITCMAISEDSSTLITASLDSNIVIWKLNSLKRSYIKVEQLSRGANQIAITTLEIDRGSKHILVLLKNHNLEIWKVAQATGNYYRIQELTLPYTTTICCDNDENIFYSGTYNGRLEIIKKANHSFFDNKIVGQLIDKVIDIEEKHRHVINVQSFKLLVAFCKALGTDQLCHGSLRLLYLAVLSQSDELVQLSLDTFGYKDNYYPDVLHPLKLALEIDSHRILSIFSRYIHRDGSAFYLNEKILLKGLTCSSSEFKSTVINNFFVEGQSTVELKSSIVGDREHINIGVVSPFFHRDDKFLRRIDDSWLRIFGVLGRVNVDYMTSSFPFNTWIGSDFMVNLLETLAKCDDEIISSYIGGFILHLWHKNMYYLIIYSIIYWIFTGCTAISIVYCQNKTDCISFFSFSINFGNLMYYVLRILGISTFLLLLIYETLVMIRRPLKHFTGIYNIMDLIVYIATLPIYLLHLFALYDRSDFAFWNFLITLYLLLIGTRSVINLRVLNGARYLIAMLINVFYDIRYFLIVLIYAIVSFALIEVEITKTLGTFTSSKEVFYKELDKLYGIGYGNWSGNETFPWNQYFYFIIETLLFPLILFNFLIAMISETFNTFQQNKRIIDQRELIEMLLDFSCFASRIKWYRNNNDVHYLHLVVPFDENNVTIDDVFKQILDVTEQQKIELDNIQQKIVESINETMLKAQNRLEARIEKIEQLIAKKNN